MQAISFLEELRATLTGQANGATEEQKMKLARAAALLSQLGEQQSERNRLIFVTTLLTVMGQPKLDSSLANGPLRETIRQFLRSSVKVLSAMQDRMAESYDVNVLNKSEEIAEVRIDFDNRRSYGQG